jgi:GDP-L-fucose synthase
MNVDTLKALGWRYSINLKEGLASTYAWFLANQDSFRG